MKRATPGAPSGLREGGAAGRGPATPTSDAAASARGSNVAPLSPLRDATKVKPLALAILGAVAFRAACYDAMTAAAVWAERRPAPGGLPDVLLTALPYVEGVARSNYLLWLAVYLPLTLAFLATEPRRWTRYMVTGGLVSLARGLTIVVTGLGPPDAGSGIPAGANAFDVWLQLISPWSVFAHGSAQAYLTKDLFFSGHTATTFLLVLYLWPRPRLRWIALAAHLVVAASVLLARIHYSIDVVGAWAMTFAIFALREWRPAATSPR